jgi:hypothetical protein
VVPGGAARAANGSDRLGHRTQCAEAGAAVRLPAHAESRHAGEGPVDPAHRDR